MFKRILICISTLTVGIGSFAQTGVLYPDAQFRNLPENSVASRSETTEREMPYFFNEEDGTQQRRRYSPIMSDNLKLDPVLEKIYTSRCERPIPGSSRIGNNPVLYMIGDSTMRNEVDGKGRNAQWGWGYYVPNYFDSKVITVENQGLGGESTRSFLRNWLYPILRGSHPGDWMAIQLGHNERGNGVEVNSGRFRGSLPGSGKEYVEATLEGSGTRENVFTYGEYLRIIVNEVRLRGVKPILLTLTQTNRIDEDGNFAVDTRNDIIREIAQEMNVPLIDFNAAIREKFAGYFAPEKTKDLYIDGIHTSSYGAVINADTFAEELRKRPDIELSRYLLPEKKSESAVRKGNKPVLFIIGDSTEEEGQSISKCFNNNKLSIDNRSIASESARSFLNSGKWNYVYDALRPGDFVVIRFGKNDYGEINTGKAIGEFGGNSDRKEVLTMEATSENEAVYSYGWYLRKYCLDIREKGAVPIILSPIVKQGNNGIDLLQTMYSGWAKEAADQLGVQYIGNNMAKDFKQNKSPLRKYTY